MSVGTRSGSPGTRIDYVDGLRAVAVLSVVIFHAAKWFPTLPRGVAEHVLYEGAHGVDLFFVISGFCLSYPTLLALRHDSAATFDLTRYWAHRIVRILPPFYGALALFAIGALVLGAFRFDTPAPAWVAPASIVAVLRQTFFLDGTRSWTNGSFWSLALEFRWYFLFPALLWLWVRLPRMFGALAVASLVLYNFTLLTGEDFATLPAFMLGIVAADVSLRARYAWRWAIPGLVASVGIALLFEPKAVEAFAYEPQIGWELAGFFFVIAAGGVPLFRAVLAWRPMALIGLASYSIYLMHEPVIAFVETNSTAGPWLSAVCGLGVGLLFWIVLERSTTGGALRRRMMPPVEAVVGWVIRSAGVQPSIRIEAPRAEVVAGAQAKAPETIAAPVEAGSRV